MKKGRVLVVTLTGLLLAGTGSLGFARDLSRVSKEFPGNSAAGQANNNAQFSPTATRGLDRALERMSPQGLAHEKATDHQKPGTAKQGKKKEAANSTDR